MGNCKTKQPSKLEPGLPNVDHQIPYPRTPTTPITPCVYRKLTDEEDTIISIYKNIHKYGKIIIILINDNVIADYVATDKYVIYSLSDFLEVYKLKNKRKIKTELMKGENYKDPKISIEFGDLGTILIRKLYLTDFQTAKFYVVFNPDL
jgi:hypothetical protein